MNNAPFYLGQKVVQLLDGVYFETKKGQEWVVLNIRYGCCAWLVNIGLPKKFLVQRCGRCGLLDNHVSNNHWVRAEYFAPIEENTYEDVTKQLAKLPVDEVPDVKEILVNN